MATSKTEAKSEPAEGAGEGAGPGPSKGKKMLVLVLALVVLLVAGGGAWIFWSRHKAQQALDEGEEEVQAAEHKKKDEDKKPPAYLTLDNMVVNLADPGGERVAQIGVTLELIDEKASEKVRLYLPMIRNDVLLLMSQKKAEELLGREGKEQLAAEILEAASGHLGGGGKKGKDQPEAPIRRVLFSSLIIQ